MWCCIVLAYTNREFIRICQSAICVTTNAIVRIRKKARLIINVRTKTAIVSLVTVVEAMVRKIKCVEGKCK